MSDVAKSSYISGCEIIFFLVFLSSSFAVCDEFWSMYSPAYDFTVDGNPGTARFRRLRENHISMDELLSHAFHKVNLVLCQPASVYLRLWVHLWKLCKWSVKVWYKNNKSQHVWNFWNFWVSSVDPRHFIFLQFTIFSFLWTLDIFLGPSTIHPRPSTFYPRPSTLDQNPNS